MFLQLTVLFVVDHRDVENPMSYIRTVDVLLANTVLPWPGPLYGIHAEDACDSSFAAVAAQPRDWDAKRVPSCGPGGITVASLADFPPSASARSFLERSWEGWRRLECADAPTKCLSSLPTGLGALSLQVSRSGLSTTHRGLSAVHMC